MEKKPLHMDNLTIDEVWGYLKGVESQLERLQRILKIVGLVLYGVLLGYLLWS